MKKKIFIGIGVVILGLIIISAIGGSGNKGNSQQTITSNNSPQPTATPEKINARDLADDFDNNQVAAEAKWKDKLVEFSAEISNITDTGISFQNVATKQFSMAQISCKIQDKEQLLPLKNGQTVTVKGVVGTQTIGVIEVKNCEVVQ
ncbi:MAG: hypothetical protein G01um10147_979 [Microgenomates group bacterium Gr01-1014_7]|nr:MAG: hypothetical protein G01um10147_979 [Microgenomates group bacterium Gr01-1014_7]